MKTIKLEDSTAKEIYKTASSELKIILEENFGKSFFIKSLKDKIKNEEQISWEEIAEEKGIHPVNSLPYRNPQSKLERHLNASFKINHISEVLNDGFVFDWLNDNQYKYYPYFKKSSSGWMVCDCRYGHYSTDMGFGIFYYKDSKTTLYAANQFLNIYIDYLPE